MKDEGDESFAAMFEESLKHKRREVRPGEKVVATIVTVGQSRALLDLGDGIDGFIEHSELAEPGQKPDVKVGDRIEGFVLRLDGRIAELGTSVGKGPGARLQLDEASETGVPVEGVITAVNTGGFVVEIAAVRCFCPLGQMDVRRIEDTASWIGQKHRFRVIERKGRDYVLSRRVLIEAEQREKATETRKRLEPGARFTGTVTSVREFGAFVDIGGVEGLVPVSELGWARGRPQDVVQPGQSVQVEVLRLESAVPNKKGGTSERITLSMKALATDPFEETAAALTEGLVVRGLVMRIQPFGAFVQLVPGVEGLIHVSAFGRRVATPDDLVKVGEKIAVRIEAVDREARRVALSFVTAEEAAAFAPAAVAAPVVAAPKGGVVVRKLEGDRPATTPASTPTLEILGTLVRAAPALVSTEASLQAAPAAPRVAGPSVGAIVEATVDKIEPFGLFVTFAGGRGLVPGAETGTPRGADLKRAFPVGSVFQAVVQEIRPDGKIRLSKSGAEQAAERAEAEAWLATQKPGGGGRGLGTFADLLKNRK